MKKKLILGGILFALVVGAAFAVMRDVAARSVYHEGDTLLSVVPSDVPGKYQVDFFVPQSALSDRKPWAFVENGQEYGVNHPVLVIQYWLVGQDGIAPEPIARICRGGLTYDGQEVSLGDIIGVVFHDSEGRVTIITIEDDDQLPRADTNTVFARFFFA